MQRKQRMTQQRKSAKAGSSPSTTSIVSVSGPLGSRPSSEALPPVLQLRPYQQRWIDDDSRFKGAVKSARIGFSFATAAEAVLDCIEHPGATWTVLSASKAQSVEFIEEGVRKIVDALGAVAEVFQEN